MKPNHHSLAYKQQKQPNKTYKDLKQKQKMKIADWMFRETCIFYKENGEIPNEEVAKQIIDRIYEKLKSLAIWVPYEEVYRAYLLKLHDMSFVLRKMGYRKKSSRRRKRRMCRKRKREAVISGVRYAAGE